MKRFTLVVIILCLFLFSACGSGAGRIPEDGETVMTVGNHTITAGEYRYWLLQNKQSYEQAYGSSYWTTSEGRAVSREIISLVNEYLTDRYSLMNLAEEKGIVLSEEEKSVLRESFENTITSDVAEQLSQLGISKDEYFRINIADQAVIEKAAEYLYSSPETAETVLKDKNELNRNYITVRQLMIKNDEGDDVNANRKLAESICDSARRGEDFDGFIEKYSESAATEITFARNDDSYAEYFRNSAEKLEINEVSDVLEYADDWQSWFLIIKRVPLNEDSLAERLADTAVDRFVSEYRDKLNVSYCDGFDDFEITDFA